LADRRESEGADGVVGGAAQRQSTIGDRWASEGSGFLIRGGVVIGPEWAKGLREEDINTPEKLRAARIARGAPGTD